MHFHNRLLHAPTNNLETPTSSATIEQATSQERRSCHAAANREEDAVLFQVIPVQLYGNEKVKQIYAFVDDGSNATMLDAEVARELNLYGHEEVLELQWLNNKTASENSQVVELSISSVEKDAKKYKMSQVFITSSLALPTQSLNVKNLQLNNAHLSELPAFSYRNVQPKMIISLTHAFLTVPIEIPRCSLSPGPIAARTRLGWMVYGPVAEEVQSNRKIACHARSSKGKSIISNELEEVIRNYFDMETFGIKPNVKPLRSDDDEKALSILKSTTRYVENRYEAGLLWRQENISFPETYQLAMKRLESIERKMKLDQEYALEYCKKIDEYVMKGYARELTEEEACQRTQKTFYLPHFAVRNPNKKGLRLVFNAAAEINNISLNKALLPGPDINQTLLSILFKFRQAPIAVCGDIKEMFHQINILKEDQDSQRFLWRNGNSANTPKTYVMQRMIFGATCSPTIAQFVKNTNAQRFIAKYSRAVKGIIERHYVDDYVDSFQNESEAIQVVREVINIHKAGGFEIRNFVSNSEKLKNVVGNSTTNEPVCVEGSEVERILGMHWLSKPDVFMFVFKFNKVPAEIISLQRKPTKRETLSVTMSIFDPFGLLANFTVCAKILMQSIWKTGIQWDDELPDGIYEKWRNWLDELKQVQNFRVARCYFAGFEKAQVDLHLFCDASEQALAAVAYWRFMDAGQIKLSFVAGKTSCAPTRFHSIPKLELQAAVVAVRLKDLILKCHEANIGKIIFWSDSNTVIQWIRSDHRNYRQYVANRVSEILEGTTIKDWRWCPGELNPADDATRAKFKLRYNAEGRWKYGPSFLLVTEKDWPLEPNMKSEKDKSAEELKSKHFAFLSKQVSKVIPNINRFSFYGRLKRSMAWVFRYVANLKRKARSDVPFQGELTSDEESDAEFYLCRWVQQEAFTREYASLIEGKPVSKCSSIKTLNPYLEKDLIRVGGRIDNATFIDISAKRPIILPKDHQVTRLLTDWFHRKLHHVNTSTVINEIRQRFWITSIRTLVRNIESSCTFCKVRKAKPQPPQMGPLPPDRVTPYVRPFTYTGLDFFGPITVTIRRRHEKRWVALFTCLTVRAVHLEIATDLSSDACLLCIQNFINRRGVKIQIRSNNGTNFVGISKELRGVKDFLGEEKIKAGLSPLGIKWIFNTPLNPSAGGAWERLVQSVKKPLYIMLKEHKPRLETFQSLLIEAENIVNSRPLTHLPVTPDDPEPLTPNHFLLGSTSSTQTPAPFEPRLLCLRKQWRVLQALKNGFWKQWIREYLPELTRRTKWCFPVRPVAVGSLVLVCDEKATRSQWMRGRIINLYYGQDKVARSADVRTSGGVFKRPVSKLALLDVEDNTNDMGESPPPGSIHGGGDVI